MSSLCSSIIKADDVNIKGKRVVRNFGFEEQIEENKELKIQLEEELEKREEDIRLKLEEAEQKYQEIISSAQLESDRLIQQSKDEVAEIEKKAYDQGHSQGMKNGYEDGYKEAYEDNIEKAKYEASEIIENANKILIESKDEVAKYMKVNKSNILEISISIAEQVLRERFEDTSSMDNLIESVIKEYELKENFVIKVNSIYKKSIDEQILSLKETHQIKGDVFVLSDESIEPGNAIIDNVKGRLVVGIDGIMDKIKEELL